MSREDWIAAAMAVLIAEGIDRVRILRLSARLGVSRSSFYWYFADRQALLDALLGAWARTNTQCFLDACAAPADGITGAVCNLFGCFIDPARFDPRLDFAIREWSRRSGSVRRVVDRADAERLAAVAATFRRHGYAETEADMRARILYFMQIGYYALELREPLETRLARVPEYIYGFTGRAGSEAEIAALCRDMRAACAERPASAGPQERGPGGAPGI